MKLVQAYPTGAEEWMCHVCGRRFVMQWPPHYKRIILEAGDEHAYHSATKDSDVNFLSLSEVADSESDETQSLANWQEWLDQLNFGK